MSKLAETIEPLPYALADQVSGYARSVVGAAPNIFRDAGVKLNPASLERIEFIAGMRKLLSILESNYWVLDNAGALLPGQAENSQIRVGSSDLSRNGEYHQQLHKLLDGFRKILSERELLHTIRNMSYSEIAREIADGY